MIVAKFTDAVKEPHYVRSNVKSMLMIIVDIQAIFHRESLSSGQRINEKFYWKVLKQLRKKHLTQTFKQQQLVSPLWKESAYISLLVRKFLISKNITTLPHFPYLLDLSSWKFLLFPKMGLRMKGCHFNKSERIK